MKKRPNLLNAIAVSCSLFLLLVPTSLWVIGESGPGVQAQQIAIKVTQPEALNFAWSTDQAGAVGGTWKVTTTNFVTGQVNTVAMGQATPVPPPGEQGSFTIPANSFLQATRQRRR